jgi:hypothetical protein
MSKRLRIEITRDDTKELDELRDWIKDVNSTSYFYRKIIHFEPENLLYYRDLTLKCYDSLIGSVVSGRCISELQGVGAAVYTIALKNVLGDDLCLPGIMKKMAEFSNYTFTVDQLVSLEFELICKVDWSGWIALDKDAN